MKISLNSLLLAKKEFLKGAKNSKFSSLLTSSLGIRLFSLGYVNRMVYDNEISVKRQLDESLVLGFKFDL